MAYGEDDNKILALEVLVHCNVAGPAARDHQLAKPTRDRAANQRVTLEQREAIEDQAGCFDGGLRIAGREEIREPIEVRPRALFER
jgi:hypothetical protein